MQAYYPHDDSYAPDLTFAFDAYEARRRGVLEGLVLRSQSEGLMFTLELPETGDYYGDQHLYHGWKMDHEEGRRLRDYLNRIYPA